MVSNALKWLDHTLGTAPDKPFFLHMLPDATHHPYSVPKGYANPFANKADSEDTRYTNYLNSMHYVDACLQDVVDKLTQLGAWKDTIVVITGDHNEAFGANTMAFDHHRNYLHKNFLFEENVRSFVILHDAALADAAEVAGLADEPDTADHAALRTARLRGAAVANEYLLAKPFMAPWQPRGSPTPLGPARATVSHRPGNLGDVMPTVLALAGAADPWTALPTGTSPLLRYRPGQNLLAKDYQRRVEYFHKTASPMEWGLRDGRWKFIGRQIGGGGQLFDLVADPLEKTDVAADHPGRVEAYADMCQAWFVVTHCAFALRLVEDGYPFSNVCRDIEAAGAPPAAGSGPAQRLPAPAPLAKIPDLSQPGPTSVTAGFQDEEGTFYQVDPLLSFMHVVSFYTEWVPYVDEEAPVVYLWAPADKLKDSISSVDHAASGVFTYAWAIKPDWHSTWVRIPVAADGLTPGDWTLHIWRDSTQPPCATAAGLPIEDSAPRGCFDTPLLSATFPVVFEEAPPPEKDGEAETEAEAPPAAPAAPAAPAPAA